MDLNSLCNAQKKEKKITYKGVGMSVYLMHTAIRTRPTFTLRKFEFALK